MRTGRAARRDRILMSLPESRQQRVLSLKSLIDSEHYAPDIDGKLELVVDDLIDEAIKLRA
ncbi:MAG: hypothetical protein HUU29_01860 [Planctomycetaceae bacterium]|nr:hypothetical protein [Planctomycetaceae bacterium]